MFRIHKKAQWYCTLSTGLKYAIDNTCLRRPQLKVGTVSWSCTSPWLFARHTVSSEENPASSRLLASYHCTRPMQLLHFVTVCHVCVLLLVFQSRSWCYRWSLPKGSKFKSAIVGVAQLTCLLCVSSVPILFLYSTFIISPVLYTNIHIYVVGDCSQTIKIS